MNRCTANFAKGDKLCSLLFSFLEDEEILLERGVCVYIILHNGSIDMKIAKWRIQSWLSELKPLKSLNNILKGLYVYPQWLYTERCAIKSIFHGYVVWIEKSLSGSLFSKPCDAEQ